MGSLPAFENILSFVILMVVGTMLTHCSDEAEFYGGELEEPEVPVIADNSADVLGKTFR